MIRLVLTSTTLAVVTGAIAYAACMKLAPHYAGPAILFAAGVNTLACWLSFVPVALCKAKNHAYLPYAALAASVLRLLIVGSVTFGAMQTAWWPTWPLTIWMLVYYLLMLAAETVIVARMVSRSFKPTNGVVSA